MLFALTYSSFALSQPLLADITNLSTSTTNEIVNISKRMLGKLSTGVQNIMEMENNMENLDAKMKASLNIVKGIAKNGVDHFKSVESAQETHDFPHAVLEEAAGISSYKVDEIENVKGRMKILTQSCKENVQKVKKLVQKMFQNFTLILSFLGSHQFIQLAIRYFN